ncbi:MAG: sulfotransferase domain-containing protein [Alphaproteobacteria bacterium]|nr:sulfotransferase domain-containing protein [Alphaproteobacteria bacterium]
MTEDLPRREINYFTNFSNSARWDLFAGRDTDIFVCAPPKTGTTWTQTLCCLLLFGWREFDIRPSDISPWYDATFEPVDEINALIEAQDHRRLIKTHTPLDGIPYSSQWTFVTVYRDPRDVFFSALNHKDNVQLNDFSISPEDDISAPFREWVQEPAGNGGAASGSLERFIVHFKTFKRFSHLTNIHFFHYSEMKRNLPAAIAGLARVLGIEVTQDDIAQISRIADIQNMRKNADQFAPDAKIGVWKSNEQFFNKGTGGQWRDDLSAEDLALYDERMSDLLPAEDIAWLHHGAMQHT